MKPKPKSPLPKPVKILDRNFAVEYHKAEDLGDRVGEMVYHEQRIRVSDMLPKRTEQQIVVHELVHSADEVMGIGLKESQVQAVALVVCEMIRNNPHLVSYICK